MTVTLVAGARPNFMKIAPIIAAIKQASQSGSRISYRLVHTGQHYDKSMSDTFFTELGIPEPHVNLGCGGGTQAEQTAAIMVEFERELISFPTDLVIVVGDVTSTMACSIVAKKLNTKVAHVEAGIRSFDLSMPEEINRIVTDSITDYFFTTSVTAGNNLRTSGVPDDRIFFVGNVMIDTLLFHLPRFQKPEIYDRMNLSSGNYFVLTLHRPGNVDSANNLNRLLNEIGRASRGLPMIFPMHPRTLQVYVNLEMDYKNLIVIKPLGYLEFNFLVQNCKAVITDSGGITEETTVMGIPCLTLRNSTERPETVDTGTNELIGTNPEMIGSAMDKLFAGKWKKGAIPEKWDGNASQRIVNHLLEIYARG